MKQQFTQSQAMQAITARRDGIWDDPELQKLGELHGDAETDIARIEAMTIPTVSELNKDAHDLAFDDSTRFGAELARLIAISTGERYYYGKAIDSNWHIGLDPDLLRAGIGITAIFHPQCREIAPRELAHACKVEALRIRQLPYHGGKTDDTIARITMQYVCAMLNNKVGKVDCLRYGADITHFLFSTGDDYCETVFYDITQNRFFVGTYGDTLNCLQKG